MKIAYGVQFDGHGKDRLHPYQNPKTRRFDSVDLGSVRGASNRETKGRSELGSTSRRRNLPPCDKLVERTSERWDSTRRRWFLLKRVLPLMWWKTR